MTEQDTLALADGDRARSWIARVREQNGWKETKDPRIEVTIEEFEGGKTNGKRQIEGH